MSDSEFWMKCECGHVWLGAYLPMVMETFAKLLSGAHCPKCGNPSSKMFMAQAADIEAAKAQR